MSTPAYYKVCGELIAEVAQLFDKPRFFHLGYDEETAGNQVNNDYVVVRQHELWWHDFEFFVAEVQRHGMRPWIWSDYGWKHHDEYFAADAQERAAEQLVLRRHAAGDRNGREDCMANWNGMVSIRCRPARTSRIRRILARR